MTAFRDGSARAFAERLTAHLVANYPSSSATLGGPDKVSAFVNRIIGKANGFGIKSKGAVSILAELAIQFGEDFERSPVREWTLNILAHPALPGSAKAEAIGDRHAEATQGRVLIRF